jgi:hypothetical protein
MATMKQQDYTNTINAVKKELLGLNAGAFEILTSFGILISEDVIETKNLNKLRPELNRQIKDIDFSKLNNHAKAFATGDAVEIVPNHIKILDCFYDVEGIFIAIKTALASKDNAMSGMHLLSASTVLIKHSKKMRKLTEKAVRKLTTSLPEIETASSYLNLSTANRVKVINGRINNTPVLMDYEQSFHIGFQRGMDFINSKQSEPHTIGNGSLCRLASVMNFDINSPDSGHIAGFWASIEEASCRLSQSAK